MYAPPFLLPRAAWFNSYWSFAWSSTGRSASTASSPTTARCTGVGTVGCCRVASRLRSATARRRSMRNGCRGPGVGRGCASAVAARCRSASVTPAIGRGATSAGIPSSATAAETVVAPAVAIAPTGPWAHSQENAVIEVAWSVEAIRSACVRRIVVVAIGANRWSTDIDDNLRPGRWRDGQGCEQC